MRSHGLVGYADVPGHVARAPALELSEERAQLGVGHAEKIRFVAPHHAQQPFSKRLEP